MQLKGREWPSASVVRELFGSWREARGAAAIAARATGQGAVRETAGVTTVSAAGMGA
jgi:hypothetical protein